MLLFFAVVAGLLISLLTYCLRVGVVGSRGGQDAHRDTQPIRYWIGIAALALATALSIGGFIVTVLPMVI
jgi:hypothetical protein